MSDQPAAATVTDAPADDQQQPDAQPKPTETVDFWKQKAREQERRAKENSDAARRLAEIEGASKTEAQKAAERLSEAEKRAAEAEARVVRRDIAIEHKLTAEDAALLDTITDEAAMRALAQRLAGGSDKPSKNHVPREGNNPRPTSDPMRDFTRDLFARATE